jgi:hypothetical protein
MKASYIMLKENFMFVNHALRACGLNPIIFSMLLTININKPTYEYP